MIRLPPTGLTLPASWDAASDARWLELRDDARALRGNLLSSREFRDSADAIRVSLKNRATDEVVKAIRARSGARALAWLWGEVDGDCRDTISVHLIQAIQKHHPKPGLMLLSYLENVYFARFDDLDGVNHDSADITLGAQTELSSNRPLDTRAALAQYLGEGWAQHGSYSGERIALLMDENAPALVARSIKLDSASVVDGIREWQLDGHTGRFLELVRQFLYLDELRLLPIGEGGPLLDEMRLPEVHGEPHLRGRLLGHAALVILIERAEWGFPGEIWRDFVLDIAGDPRLDHRPGFTRWWSVLGSELAERVMGWLARAELELFLEALQKFSESQPDMERMLPARRKLLEGLINEGVVRRSRLFLGGGVRKFIVSRSPAAQWESAVLSGKPYAERALLYLDCGEFHIVEGSHNTKLWIFMERPSARLTDSRTRSFTYKELTGELAEGFEERRRNKLGDDYTEGHVAVAHQGLWQKQFLDFLADRGVAIDPEAVLIRSDHLKLRQRGLAVVRQRAR